MTSEAAVRKEIAELRARGDDAAARERLKQWRTEKQGAKREPEPKPDEGERWLSDLELSLLRFHQEAGQRRGHGRAHRLPFVQCRQCDALRQEALASRNHEPHGAVAASS